MPRPVLGAEIGPVSILTSPTPAPEPAPEPTPDPSKPVLADVIATLVSFSPDQVVVAFPSFNPAAAQAPIETRVYLAPAGSALPADAAAWAASPFPYSTSNVAVGPEGAPNYAVPVPTAPVGDYLGQVLHFFAD